MKISIYQNDNGQTVVERNGNITNIISGSANILVTGNAVAVKQNGHSVLDLKPKNEAIYLAGVQFTGPAQELADQLATFFFSDLEGFQSQFLFDAPATGDTFALLPRSLPSPTAGQSFALTSKCYMKGPNSSSYSCIVQSSSFGRYYDSGSGLSFVGSPNSLPSPSLVTGGGVLAAFLVASGGQLYYRIQPKTGVPALSCRLLYSITKF